MLIPDSRDIFSGLKTVSWTNSCPSDNKRVLTDTAWTGWFPARWSSASLVRTVGPETVADLGGFNQARQRGGYSYQKRRGRLQESPKP